LFLAWQAWQGFREDRIEQEASLAGIRAENILSKWFPVYRDNMYIAHFLAAVSKQTFQNPDPPGRFRLFRKLINNRISGIFDFLYLDGTGRQVKSLSDFSVRDDWIREFYAAKMRSQKGGLPTGANTSDRLAKMFGPLQSLEFESGFGWRFFPANYRTKRTMVFFSKPASHGTIVAFLNKIPDWEAKVFRFLLDLRNKKNPSIRIGLIDLNDKHPQDNFPRGIARDELTSMLPLLPNLTKAAISGGGFLWSRMIVSPRLMLVVAQPHRIVSYLETLSRQFEISMFAIFFLAGIWVWFADGGKGALPFSIRWKLTFLLGFSIGIPLLLFGLSARGFLRDFRQVMEQDIFHEQERAIKMLDQRFMGYIGGFEKIIKNRLRKPADSVRVDISWLTRQLRSLERDLQPAICDIVDLNGNSFYKNSRPFSGKADQIMAVFRHQASNILDESSFAREAKTQMFSATAEIYGFNPEFFSSQISPMLNSLSEFVVGNMHGIGVLMPLRTDSGERFLIHLGWDVEQLERIFARRFLTDSRIAIIDPGLIVNPASFPLGAALQSYRKRIMDAGIPCRFRLENDNKTFLVTAMRGAKLNRCAIIAYQTEKTLLASITKQTRVYLGIALAILLLGGMIWNLLAWRFLGPIEQLSRGIAALQARAFQLRLPVVNNDELGELTTAFNHMMEGMAELELARLVQETFFPPKPVELDGWRIQGECMPAAQVGGDHFDFFLLDDHHLAILIGDVSGHGVSAALVVAMAKALIAHPAHRFSPAATLNLMRIFFQRSLSGRKMMTCFCALLDTETGTMLCANAGQSYPIIVQNRISCYVSLPGKPLGSRSTQPIAACGIDISAQCSMLFYTDGLVESLTPTGEMIGYDRLSEALPELIRGDPGETQQAIKDWHRRLTDGAPALDDITLVVLQSPAVLGGKSNLNLNGRQKA